MILQIYVLILSLAFILITIGYWKEQPFIHTVGFTFLFIAGLVMMNTHLPITPNPGIEFKNATITTTVGSTTTETATYDTYTNQTLGFLLSTMSFILILFTIINPKVKFRI